MSKQHVLGSLLAATLIAGCSSLAFAANFIWDVPAGGTHNWQQDGNWNLSGFPNSGSDTANLSVPLSSNLTVNLGASPVTVGALTIGGSAGPVTTNISGGTLVFNNIDAVLPASADFNDDGTINGADLQIWENNFGSLAGTQETGDADGDGVVGGSDFLIWQRQFGTAGPDLGDLPPLDAYLTSQGTSGSTNTINSLVQTSQRVDVRGNNSIELAGGMQEVGTTPSGIRSFLPDGERVLISGPIAVIANPAEPGDADPRFGINNYLNFDLDAPPSGTVEITGNISGNGAVQAGWNWNITGGPPPNMFLLNPLPTVILSGDNTFTGEFNYSRANIVLQSDTALGAGLVRAAGQSNQVGFNFIVEPGPGETPGVDPNRTISNEMAMNQWTTIKGEYSLTWEGRIYQNLRRGFINLLPEGATLNLTGPVFPNRTGEEPPEPGRDMHFDGTGTTIISGGFFDEYDDINDGINPGNYVGGLMKRGTGALYITGGNSDFSGETVVQGGNLHFATNADFSNTSTINASRGAVGVDTGVSSNNVFLSRLNPSNSGGLMLAASDASATLDFNAFPLTNAAGMTVAAPETGLTYSGTITPSNSDNTYRLGGGAGTITLPNNNQLTGSRSLYVANGGEVELTGTNNFTGATTVTARYATSRQVQAEMDRTDDAQAAPPGSPNNQLYLSTTLTVSHLGNGGSPSSIGSASSSADNLLIRGSTLKYTGGATSTNRLFTVGTGGATIDASGSGPISFSNTSPLGMEVAPDRQGQTDGFTFPYTIVSTLPNTDDLVIGMPVSGLFNPTSSFGNFMIPEGTVIAEIMSNTSIRLSQPVALDSFASGGTLVIGDFLRTLTLTGSNTDNNTMASLVADSPQGPVGITKSGSGTWVLTNSSNAYSGPTTVEEGTLSLTAAFLGDDSEVHLFSGATLDLSFSGTDTIGALFIDGVPQATGTWGSLGSGAANTSSLFSGSGMLNVTIIGAMQAVPEPGSLIFALGGLLAFVTNRRRSVCSPH